MLDLRVSPQRLPAGEFAPATWTVSGRVETADGSHPSALRQVDFDIDKDVGLNVEGYPSCRRRKIDRHNTRTAFGACSQALIGKGRASIEVAFPESTPMLHSGPLLVFNGGEREGEVKLLIHAFVAAPSPAAIITTVTIRRRGAGLETVSRVPMIADGMGSLLDFKFKLGKTYSYKGKKYGYFEAKCPDGVFKANVKKVLFKNEAKVPGVAAQTTLKGGLAVPCTPLA